MTKKARKSKVRRFIDLRAIEEEVLGEGMVYMLKRMEEKLREKRESFSPGRGVASAECPKEKTDDKNHVREYHSSC